MLPGKFGKELALRRMAVLPLADMSAGGPEGLHFLCAKLIGSIVVAQDGGAVAQRQKLRAD